MNSSMGSTKQQIVKFRLILGISVPIFLLTACENGIVGTGYVPGPDPIEINRGVAQKGPFEIGSNIVITTRPGPDYVPTSVDQLQTLDDIGSFEFTFKPDTVYEIAVTGRHFNEITGALSQETMTLKSTYYHEENGKSFVSVNILTHMIHSRINHLIAIEQLHPRDAVAQARQELVDEIKGVIFADHLDNYNFSDMTVYNNYEDSDTNANAVLLFISATFYRQSEMYENSHSIEEMLTTIAVDLELDGKIDGEEIQDAGQTSEGTQTNGPAILSTLDFAARLLNPDIITDNLSRYSIDKTGAAIPVPSIDFLLDNDADGITNDIDSDDDGDGIPDDSDTEPYQFQIIPAAQTFNTSQDVDVDIDLQFNNPEDPTANPVYLGFVIQPQNGTLSGVYPNLHYTPAQGFTGTDNFTYQVNCVPCSAVVAGVYTSEEITVTINIGAP